MLSATDFDELSGFVVDLRLSASDWSDFPPLGSGRCSWLLAGDGETDSSTEMGLGLLPLRQVDFESLTSFALVVSLSGSADTPFSVIGSGWASEPSPITAISPGCCVGGVSFVTGVALDQKAQVEPAWGGGDCAGSSAGASCITTSSLVTFWGSSADAGFSGSTAMAVGAGVVHKLNQEDVVVGRGSDWATGGVSIICAGGVDGLGGSGCSSSMGSMGFTGVFMIQLSQPACGGCVGVGVGVGGWISWAACASTGSGSGAVEVPFPFGCVVILLSSSFFVAGSCSGSSFVLAGLEASGWDMDAFAWSEAAADELSLL